MQQVYLDVEGDLEDVGDEAIAARLTGESAVLGTVEGRIYFVRVHDVVVFVITMAADGLDADMALDALRTVVGRL